MPAKKTVKTSEKAPAKKPAVKKEEEKKETVKAAVKKAPAKTATAKKEAPVEKAAPAKKAPAKKAPAKKAAAKKAPAKKTEAKKADASKKSVQDYVDVINWKKGEAHAMDWLYIEINAGDLLTEVEAGADNLATACNAILNCMLEGDGYIFEPKEADKINKDLTVRYYCDNLSEDRKHFYER